MLDVLQRWAAANAVYAVIAKRRGGGALEPSKTSQKRRVQLPIKLIY